MVICYPGLGRVEKLSTTKGYFDPKMFPTVAAFHALGRSDQDYIAKTGKVAGLEVAVVSLQLLSSR